MKSQLIAIVGAVVLIGCKSISIHQVVFDGNIGAIKQHLDAGAEVDAKDDKFVGTFLHWAAAGGQKEIVELLIAKGADVNATDGDGDTALHLAGSTTASTAITELLISKGADVNAMNMSPPGRRIGGMTPLDMATLGNRTEIAALLRKQGGKTAKELGVNYQTTDSILRKDGKTGIVLNKVIEHATIADPAHYNVEFENEYVKVLRVKYGPNEKSPMHSHNWLAGVHLTDAKAKFTPKDGKAEIRNIKAGDIGLGEPEIHTVENMTDKNWETILVELKKEYPGDISDLKRDATKVDPKHYKEVEVKENNWVRVIRTHYDPNEKSVMHDHNPGVVVFLKDTKHQIINKDGSKVIGEFKAGDCVWSEAVTHKGENFDKPLDFVFFELK